ILPSLIRLSIETGIPLVATNDAHYIDKADHQSQHILMCIQTNKTIYEKGGLEFSTNEFYIKSKDEMLDAFKNFEKDEILKAIENTEKIANRCNVSFEFDHLILPTFIAPNNQNNMDFFLSVCNEGLNKLYGENCDEKIKQRFDFEISIIKKMGYIDFYLITYDFINYAKKNKIPIGPGRGSAAGSLVAYSLKITDLNPLTYGLIFERFLNPERISMPDIDIDICQERRGEVIEYVTKKYGADKVAQIITFGTMKARAAIRDVGRVMNVNLGKIDKIAKLIPGNYNLKKALKDIPELREIYSKDSEIEKVITLSSRLENKVRHASIHAAGVVITEDSLTDIVPLYSDNKDKVISTQYQMKELEELGLLKMDFLGLRNLTNIQRAIDNIKEDLEKDLILEDIPLNVKEVYEMLSKGDSLGVFQLESQGIRKILMKLKPNRFEDLIALLALYRPGPLGSGMVESFVRCKNGLEEIKYPHESLEEVLKETYGVILYQEQVMKIANIMANYSLGEADLLRRAMGKKQADIMDENREKFVERSVKNGYTKEKATEVFNLIDKFAGYGFNKSHSA
ncbi:MAG: DNA polymerase III subunit alpha, partial [Cetobacterium sp.]